MLWTECVVLVKATASDTEPGQAGETKLGYQTFFNGTLGSNIVIDASQVVTDTIDYVATNENGLTATSTRTVLIEAAAATSPRKNTVATRSGSSTAAPPASKMMSAYRKWGRPDW